MSTAETSAYWAIAPVEHHTWTTWASNENQYKGDFLMWWKVKVANQLVKTILFDTAYTDSPSLKISHSFRVKTKIYSMLK